MIGNQKDERESIASRRHPATSGILPASPFAGEKCAGNSLSLLDFRVLPEGFFAARNKGASGQLRRRLTRFR
jgi:hypothetical protein